MQHLINNIYYVEVPEGSGDYNLLTKGYISYRTKDCATWSYTIIDGSYTIIGTGKEVLVSESLTKQVVEKVDIGDRVERYKDYGNVEYWSDIPYDKAQDSFKSLMTAHNVPNNILLLKKND